MEKKNMNKTEKGQFKKGQVAWNKGLSIALKPRTGKMVKCINCQKEFYRRPSHWGVKCCSVKCANEQKKFDNILIKCNECGKEFYIPPSYRTLRNFCSRKCQLVVLKRESNKNKPKKWKEKSKGKIWSSANADRKFSNFIREKANWRCELCGRDFSENKGRLHCSHFWSRSTSVTRYEEDNCIAACSYCHRFRLETEKQGIYRDFMLKRLGKKRYDELEKLYYQSKMTRLEARVKCMELLK